MYVNSSPYVYADGTYYQQNGSNYTVVTPPAGATVGALPPKYTTVYAPGNKTAYYYYSGYYYEKTSKGYQLTTPPAGVTVPYLPKGYTQTTQNGTPVFQFAGLTCKQYYQGGELVYQLN